MYNNESMVNATQTSNCTQENNSSDYYSIHFWLHNLITLELLVSFIGNTLIFYSTLRYNSLCSVIYMLIGCLTLVEMMSLPVAAILYLERYYRGRCDHVEIWKGLYYTLAAILHFVTNTKYCMLLLITLER